MKASRIVPAVALALALALAATANAQTIQRKPGLWEVERSGSGPGMGNMPNMQERLAHMPPEQRAQYEAYMKQHGMSFGANSMTMRYCLTPQDVRDEKESADAYLNKGKDRENCKSKTTARSATEVRFSSVCKDPDGDTREVDGRIYDLSPEHFAMEMTSRSKAHGEMKMQQKARWVSADCGNLK
jgi:hypothetical protein